MRQFAIVLMALFLGARDPSTGATRLATVENPDAGLSLRELPPETLRSIGLPFGLAVVRAGGLAERAGLRIGDVVYGINQKRVKNLEEFNRLLAEQGGGNLGFLVRRGASDFYVAVDPSGPAPREGMPKGLPAAKETLLRT